MNFLQYFYGFSLILIQTFHCMEHINRNVVTTPNSNIDRVKEAASQINSTVQSRINFYCFKFLNDPNFRSNVYKFFDTASREVLNPSKIYDDAIFELNELMKYYTNLLKIFPDDLYLQTILIFMSKDLYDLKNEYKNLEKMNLQTFYSKFNSLKTEVFELNADDSEILAVSATKLNEYINSGFEELKNKKSKKNNIFLSAVNPNTRIKKLIPREDYDQLIIIRCFNYKLKRDVFFILTPENFKIQRDCFLKKCKASGVKYSPSDLSGHLLRRFVVDRNIIIELENEKNNFTTFKSAQPYSKTWIVSQVIKSYVEYYFIFDLKKVDSAIELDD